MCGNLGILLLLPMRHKVVRTLLRTMLKITTVRGAQSAGVATYEEDGKGVRCRVVNGKRTDLSELVLQKLDRELKHKGASTPAEDESARLFQGHTRFATSSICNLAGCHPHQWLPRRMQMFWRLSDAGRYVGVLRYSEGFITHNGDLDFFTANGVTYALTDVQQLLGHLLGQRMPSDVDSACVAGLVDLLRPQGLWLASVRYGYLYGALARAGSLSDLLDEMATAAQLETLAAVFETEWATLQPSLQLPGLDAASAASEVRVRAEAAHAMADRMHACLLGSDAASGRPTDRPGLHFA